jgi:hypothetical protein
MKVVTEIYGSEKGMDLWATIVDTIDDNLKGDIFFGMISGKYVANSVTITKCSPTDFVQMIKVVRTYTGMGLKDAKDLCDLLRNNGTISSVSVIEGKKASDFIRNIKMCGGDAL